LWAYDLVFSIDTGIRGEKRRRERSTDSQREEHGGHREGEEEEKKDHAEDIRERIVAEKREKREGPRWSEHKSPPFRERREGWGTLKFRRFVSLGRPGD